MIKKITVRSYPIRLGQFLKLADLVDNGAEAKIHIQEGRVRVNGLVDTRRGSQLQDGDIVQLETEQAQVVFAIPHPSAQEKNR